MSHSPIEHAESLRIGVVDFVSPDEIKVSLDIEAPESISLNAGGPRPFPRINSYVLIPVDDGFLVGQIEWITVERSAFPKRGGMKDFGLIDLPFPLRKMSLNPLGTLKKRPGPEDVYSFSRGADAFPSIGSSVLIPTSTQLRSIVESGHRRRVKIGTSPLAGNAEVSVDPDRIFGRHLAVLGNTGSGKSCSVAGLIRWSLETAARDGGGNTKPNARFVVFDPNGEYARAFSGGDSKISARVFKVSTDSTEKSLQVPLWFWNSAEWSTFTQASAKTQRPLLKRALREVKSGKTGLGDQSEEEKKLKLRRYLSSTLISIRKDIQTSAIKDEATKFGYKIKAVKEDLDVKKSEFPGHKLQEVVNAIDTALNATHKSFVKNGETIEYYQAFNESQTGAIVSQVEASLSTLGGILYQDGPDEDVPIPFDGGDLADHLEILSEQENASQFLDFFISRIRTFLSDTRIRSVVGDAGEISLEQWLTDYIGSDGAKDGALAVLDLSLVPTEIIHVITAVAARHIFESLQRYRKLHKVALPTVLVMEEAHTFIKRYREEAENHDAASVCCQVFERIAREGRKFGLGLVLSSQRPSELSPTVLSQCNTFLLHRISNDRDQELVHRLVPDNLKGLLRELPSLASQNAILLGWASELPVLVTMNDLPEEHRPHSDDPDFWNVWTGRDEKGNTVERKIDWAAIAKDWVGSTNSSVKNEERSDDSSIFD
jgi:uncharacterized protein